MKHLIIISILLIIIVSCGKKTQLKVTAKNAATGQGFSGLDFRLMEVKPYTTSTGEVHKKVYEGTLNAQGEAVFEHRLKDRSYVITTAVPKEELCYINNTQYFLHRDDDNLTFDFRFAECAYLKLKIENVNCEGSGDLMNFRQRQSYTDWSGWSSDRIGCYTYESPDYFEVPNGLRIYEWQVNRGSNVTTFRDSVYLDINEQKVFEINY